MEIFDEDWSKFLDFVLIRLFRALSSPLSRFASFLDFEEDERGVFIALGICGNFGDFGLDFFVGRGKFVVFVCSMAVSCAIKEEKGEVYNTNCICILKRNKKELFLLTLN